MRKLFILTVIATLFGFTSFAKIWRVNNNTGITADFTTLQDAHDGASSGDSLYLESSPTSYGSLTASKKLFIIGTGYFLDQNQGLQAFTLPSKVAGITLIEGSSGSIIEGLSFNGSSISVQVNDIVIRRNNFGGASGDIPDYYTGYVYIYSSANIFITQNFALRVSNSTSTTGILISNNYLGSDGYGGDASAATSVQLHANTVAILKNNIFRRGTVSAFNSNFTNNIMYSGFYTDNKNLTSNNLANENQFGTANNNKANIDMATVFAGTGSYDSSFKLKAGSPAIGAGFGSTTQNKIDAGMYGGSTPYKLSGLPAIPSVYFLTNQPVGSNSDPIDVQVKVKSNN